MRDEIFFALGKYQQFWSCSPREKSSASDSYINNTELNLSAQNQSPANHT